MPYPLLILNGPAGVGKDYIADLMVQHFGARKLALADPMKRLALELFKVTFEQLWGPSERRGDNVVLKAGATAKVKEARWGVDPRKWKRTSGKWWREYIQRALWKGDGLSVRFLLQTMGTEWGRNMLNEDLWVNEALRTANEMLLGCGYGSSTGLTKRGGPKPSFVVITDGRFANELLAVKKAGGVAMRIEGEFKKLDGEASAHASENDAIPRAWFDFVFTNARVYSHEMLIEQAHTALAHMRLYHRSWVK